MGESTDGIWQMEINTGNMVSTVLGSFEVLSTARDEWKSWLKNPARSEYEILEVHGSADTHARSPVVITELMTNIVGLSLREEYR